MNRIWTPWRMAFIRGEKAVNCIFCLKASETQDRENFVVARAKFNLILLNIYPYTTGHLMIAPYVHQANLVQLESEVTAEMMDLARRATRGAWLGALTLGIYAAHPILVPQWARGAGAAGLAGGFVVAMAAAVGVTLLLQRWEWTSFLLLGSGVLPAWVRRRLPARG